MRPDTHPDSNSKPNALTFANAHAISKRDGHGYSVSITNGIIIAHTYSHPALV